MVVVLCCLFWSSELIVLVGVIVCNLGLKILICLVVSVKFWLCYVGVNCCEVFLLLGSFEDVSKIFFLCVIEFYLEYL